MKRILAGVLVVPLSLFTVFAIVEVPRLIGFYQILLLLHAFRAVLLLAYLWILPGLWFLYGYLRVLLGRPPQRLSWRKFWLASAGTNAAYALVSTYSWLRWGYKGEPIPYSPTINSLLKWLPLDGGLICLWQLIVVGISLVLAYQYSPAEQSLASP